MCVFKFSETTGPTEAKLHEGLNGGGWGGGGSGIHYSLKISALFISLKFRVIH